MRFQSPRSGKFVSNAVTGVGMKMADLIMFQSPRSEKFVSDEIMELFKGAFGCFNPLDRGNLYQIRRSFFYFSKEEVSIP